MKVLVTGGAGYIGSHTVRQLVKTGADVTVLDNMVYGHIGAIVDPEVKLVKGDLGDASVVYPLLMTGNFDAVIHFAAYINVGESVQNPLKYYMNNIARPLVLLGAMQAAGVKRFVFSSTCATYGVPTQIPIPETEKQDPINPYGSSKYMLEKVCKDCDRAWGLKSVFLRYFNASGCSVDGLIGEDHEPETHLIPNILLTLTGEKEYIEVFGTDYDTPDGTCIRDYIHVDDLAGAASRRPADSAYGVSTTGKIWSISSFTFSTRDSGPYPEGCVFDLSAAGIVSRYRHDSFFARYGSGVIPPAADSGCSRRGVRGDRAPLHV